MLGHHRKFRPLPIPLFVENWVLQYVTDSGSTMRFIWSARGAVWDGWFVPKAGSDMWPRMFSAYQIELRDA